MNKYSLSTCGDVGNNFMKTFKGFEFYQGVVIEIKKEAKSKKIKECYI